MQLRVSDPEGLTPRGRPVLTSSHEFRPSSLLLARPAPGLIATAQLDRFPKVISVQSALTDSRALVGSSRRDDPARVAAGGTIAPLNAARTARRAVTLTPALSHPMGEGERLDASLVKEGAGLTMGMYRFPLPSDGRRSG